MEIAEWTLLSAHLPFRSLTPVGILLADSADGLHLRVITDWSRIVGDGDEIDVWRESAAELEQKGREFGARWVLDRLEDTASHALQIGSRQTLQTADPEATLEDLYRQHVRPSPQHQEAGNHLRHEGHRACAADADVNQGESSLTPVAHMRGAGKTLGAVEVGSQIPPGRIEDLLRREILANHSLEILMQRVLDGQGAEEALEDCKRLAKGCPEANGGPVAALQYSHFMRNTLSEEEFRVLQFGPSERSCNHVRRERFLIYRRLKKLFDLEIAISRRQKRSCMALAADWSDLGWYLWESVTLARYRCLLSLAGLLFSAGIPGARNLCDTAVLGILRTVYYSAI